MGRPSNSARSSGGARKADLRQVREILGGVLRLRPVRHHRGHRGDGIGGFVDGAIESTLREARRVAAEPTK
jgi:hypothetical protein